MSDITPEEKRILSRSVEYRNSMALAEAMRAIRDDYETRLQAMDAAIKTLQQKVIQQERMLTTMMSMNASSGPS